MGETQAGGGGCDDGADKIESVEMPIMGTCHVYRTSIDAIKQKQTNTLIPHIKLITPILLCCPPPSYLHFVDRLMYIIYFPKLQVLVLTC